MTLEELRALIPDRDRITGAAISVEVDVYNWGVQQEPHEIYWHPRLEKLKIWSPCVSGKGGNHILPGNVSLDGTIFMMVLPDDLDPGNMVLMAPDLEAARAILQKLVVTGAAEVGMAGWDDDPFDLGRACAMRATL